MDFLSTCILKQIRKKSERNEHVWILKCRCNLEKKVKKSKPKKEKPAAVSEPAPQKAEDEKEIIGLGHHKDTGASKSASQS